MVSIVIIERAFPIRAKRIVLGDQTLVLGIQQVLCLIGPPVTKDTSVVIFSAITIKCMLHCRSILIHCLF
jgi:hypothetical protein